MYSGTSYSRTIGFNNGSWMTISWIENAEGNKLYKVNGKEVSEKQFELTRETYFDTEEYAVRNPSLSKGNPQNLCRKRSKGA